MTVAYKSPAALEMAIKAAAKASAQDTNRAIARFYHHRLLCRVFSEPDSPFVLKGGLGMLARTLDARHTKDIDLTTSKLDPDEAVSELNRLARKDMGDFVSFVPRGWRAIKEEDGYRDGYTVSYDVYLGAKKVSTVSVDLVSDQIEWVELQSQPDARRRAGVFAANRTGGMVHRMRSRREEEGRKSMPRLSGWVRERASGNQKSYRTACRVLSLI